MRYHVSVDGQQHEIEIAEVAGTVRVMVDGKEVKADLKLVNPPSLYSLLLANRSHELLIEQRGDDYAVFIKSELYEVKVRDDRALRMAKISGKERAGETEVRAPMPGLVVAVLVNHGDLIEKGKGLVVLEAMKMENELKAAQAGTVKGVLVSPGEKVVQGQLLVTLAS